LLGQPAHIRGLTTLLRISFPLKLKTAFDRRHFAFIRRAICQTNARMNAASIQAGKSLRFQSTSIEKLFLCWLRTLQGHTLDPHDVAD
jgi:hypothetical protein